MKLMHDNLKYYVDMIDAEAASNGYILEFNWDDYTFSLEGSDLPSIYAEPSYYTRKGRDMIAYDLSLSFPNIVLDDTSTPLEYNYYMRKWNEISRFVKYLSTLEIEL